MNLQEEGASKDVEEEPPSKALIPNDVINTKDPIPICPRLYESSLKHQHSKYKHSHKLTQDISGSFNHGSTSTN